MNAPIRLFLVDDHSLLLGGLTQMLEAQPDFTVAGTAESLAEAHRKLPAAQPHLVLLDVDLGPDRALDFLRQTAGPDREWQVLIVTAGVSDFEAVQLVHAGVSGVFHKRHAPDQLCAAIRRVAQGEVVMEPEYMQALFAAVDPQAIDARPRLAERDVIVLRHLLQGLANKEIASAMGISESSVKGLLRTLFGRLGVRTRSQLVKVALDNYREQI